MKILDTITKGIDSFILYKQSSYEIIDGKKYLYRLVWFKNERPHRTGFMQKKRAVRYMKDRKNLIIWGCKI